MLPVLEAMASGRRQGRLALMSSVSTTVTGAVEFAGGREVLMAQEAAAAVALGASHQGSTGYSHVVAWLRLYAWACQDQRLSGII